MSRSIFVSLLVVSLLWAGCDRSESRAAPVAMPPMPVKTITLAPRPIAQTSDFVGTIRSLRSTTIQPQVDGFVRQILVRAGDRVRAGQPLVQIDPDREQAAATVTEAQRAAREADLALARQNLDRVRQLEAAGAVSRSALDQAEATFKSAEAQLNALQSEIRENQVQLQYYRVTAPTAGIVGDLAVRPGDRVTPATVITTIDGSEGLEAYVSVPLEQAARLRPGLTIELLDGDGMVTATAPITFVAPRADDTTQSVLVKATLGQRLPTLRVMQYVRARVVWSTEASLAVPLVAVNRIGGQHFVFVAEAADTGFVARQRAVNVGEVVGDEYVVRAGLKRGERVITSNLQKLGDGAPVDPS